MSEGESAFEGMKLKASCTMFAFGKGTYSPEISSRSSPLPLTMVDVRKIMRMRFRGGIDNKLLAGKLCNSFGLAASADVSNC